ncbi:hypothetical protein LguiA_017592 [Lonicera macranthoides]
MGSSKDNSATDDGDVPAGDIPDTTKSSSCLFSEGEKVLVFFSDRVLDVAAGFYVSLLFFSISSLVQKAEFRKTEWKYFVHYLNCSVEDLLHISLYRVYGSSLGGAFVGITPFLLRMGSGCDFFGRTAGASSSLGDGFWDEWVGADRLMKYTEENVLKQTALDKKQGVDKNAKPARSTQTKLKISTDAKVDKEDSKSNGAKGKKRKADSSVEYTNVVNHKVQFGFQIFKAFPATVVTSTYLRMKDNTSTEKLIKIQIPSTLKKQLVDDWEFITQQNKLVKLPRSPNVDEILKKYLEYRSKKDGMMSDADGEILNGLRCYFDKSLPIILLYKRERQQYHDAVADNVSPSIIYGAEHLLRLFVKLPELLSYVIIEEETLVRLQQKLLDFLKFLQKYQSTFFLSAYDGSKVSEGSSKGKDK